MQDPIDELVNDVESKDDYNQIIVAERDEREGWVNIEWDERASSARQITELQNKVNSTVPIYKEIEVYRADITTKRVKFTRK